MRGMEQLTASVLLNLLDRDEALDSSETSVGAEAEADSVSLILSAEDLTNDAVSLLDVLLGDVKVDLLRHGGQLDTGGETSRLGHGVLGDERLRGGRERIDDARRDVLSRPEDVGELGGTFLFLILLVLVLGHGVNVGVECGRERVGDLGDRDVSEQVVRHRDNEVQRQNSVYPRKHQCSGNKTLVAELLDTDCVLIPLGLGSVALGGGLLLLRLLHLPRAELLLLEGLAHLSVGLSRTLGAGLLDLEGS